MWGKLRCGETRSFVRSFVFSIFAKISDFCKNLGFERKSGVLAKISDFRKKSQDFGENLEFCRWRKNVDPALVAKNSCSQKLRDAVTPKNEKEMFSFLAWTENKRGWRTMRGRRTKGDGE